MKLNHLIYNLREKLKLNSDDIEITDEYLAHLIGVKRSFVIKQRYNNLTKNIPEEIKQLLCLELDTVNTIDGQECYGTMLVSKHRIPATIEISGKSGLLAIRTLDRFHPEINLVPIERLPYVGHNAFLKNQIYVALDANNKLYFKSDSLTYLNLRYIQVVGVFSEPEEADKYSCENNDDNCDFFEKEYPIESNIISDVIDLVEKELSRPLNLQEDKLNNADESNRN